MLPIDIIIASQCLPCLPTQNSITFNSLDIPIGPWGDILYKIYRYVSVIYRMNEWMNKWMNQWMIQWMNACIGLYATFVYMQTELSQSEPPLPSRQILISSPGCYTLYLSVMEAFLDSESLWVGEISLFLRILNTSAGIEGGRTRKLQCDRHSA